MPPLDEIRSAFLRKPWKRVKNSSQEVIPPYAVLRVVSSEIEDGEVLVTVAKPNASTGEFLVNGPWAIGSGSSDEGLATDLSESGLVYLNSGSPSIGASVGPTSGQWYVTTSGTGFIVKGSTYSFGGSNAVVAQQRSSADNLMHAIAELDGTLSACTDDTATILATSFGGFPTQTADIYEPIVDSGHLELFESLTNQSVYNDRAIAYTSGDVVWLEKRSGYWFVVRALAWTPCWTGSGSGSGTNGCTLTFSESIDKGSIASISGTNVVIANTNRNYLVTFSGKCSHTGFGTPPLAYTCSMTIGGTAYSQNVADSSTGTNNAFPFTISVIDGFTGGANITVAFTGPAGGEAMQASGNLSIVPMW